MNSLATRFTDSFCVQLPAAAANGGMLVKIYPASPLDRPVDLTAAQTVIGRDECNDLSISEDSISRRHAVIEFDGQKHCVKDLNSTNGTFVNESRVNYSILNSGDRVRFGNQIFKFITLDGVESKYHEIIFKLMTTDGLTQAYNKRFLLDSLEREIQQSIRGMQPLCVLMMDLDRFKSINDGHGHLAGDKVLVEFVSRAMSVLRSGEVLARYGGEEFALLCSPATIEQALLAAERVRQVVSAQPVRYEQCEIPVTVSIGAYCFDPTSEIISSTEIFARADAKLYAAKQNGRNRVEH
jgi:diguanylate cyclase (GGDEF)-like protein